MPGTTHEGAEMKKLVQIVPHQGDLFALGEDGSLWKIIVHEFSVRPVDLVLLWEPPA